LPPHGVGKLAHYGEETDLPARLFYSCHFWLFPLWLLTDRYRLSLLLLSQRFRLFLSSLSGWQR